MTMFRKVNTGELANESEKMGYIQQGIFSSQLKLSELGFTIEDLFHIKMRIDGLMASIWGLFALIAQEPTADSIEFYNQVDKQVGSQLQEIKSLIKQSAFKSELND